MKRFIIGLLTNSKSLETLLGASLTMSLACSGCARTEAAKVNDSHSVAILAPADAHLAWCKGEPSSCFDAAKTLCFYEGKMFSTPLKGKFHQVPEADMAFPAMVQEGDTWRILFVCDKE